MYYLLYTEQTIIERGQNLLICSGREYELITEAHAQLSVAWNCSRFCLPVCSGGGETAGGHGVVNSSRGWGEGRQTAQGESIWSSLGRQKVKHGLLFIIHILWAVVNMYTLQLWCDGLNIPSAPVPCCKYASQLWRDVVNIPCCSGLMG
jgi:hypothetical protein